MENLLQTVHASRARQKDAASNRLSHGPPAAPPSASTPSEPEISLALMCYQPPADDYLTNRVVAYATSQRVYDWQGNARQTNFAHVELSFAFDVNGTRLFADPNHSLGFSINQFSRLYLREKTWKPEYRCVSISVPAPKYRHLLQVCTTLAQLDANLDACREGGDDLPASVVAAMDGAWDITRGGAFPYWRSYSADMPGRDGLDPGASYDAAKKK